MIIVVAALSFESQADRDHAVEITREVQLKTREQEAGNISLGLTVYRNQQMGMAEFKP